jgi:NADPH:quinone reductase-like Zn-dependent oxidoreductase
MKALISREPGGPDTLTMAELPEPVAATGEMVVSVRAVGINFPDALIIEDKYQFKPPRPFAPGGEVSGVVEAVGPDVTGFEIGDRVFGLCGWNGMAERIAIPASRCVLAPDDMDFEQAAAFLMTYATAHYALKLRADLRAGETLLVLGASGGVGLAAVELGKRMGARVVAGVSTEAKGKAAREAGAHDILVYPADLVDKAQGKAFQAEIRAICGEAGPDVVFDPVGGPYAEPTLRALGWSGRYLVIGFAAGIPSIPLNLVLLKSTQIVGVFWGAFTMRDPQANAALIADLLDHWKAGGLRPRISEVFALEQGSEAISRLVARQAIGKIVVTV